MFLCSCIDFAVSLRTEKQTRLELRCKTNEASDIVGIRYVNWFGAVLSRDVVNKVRCKLHQHKFSMGNDGSTVHHEDFVALVIPEFG